MIGAAVLIGYGALVSLVSQNRQLASNNDASFAEAVLALIQAQSEIEFNKQFCLAKGKNPNLTLPQFFELPEIKTRLENNKFLALGVPKKEALRLQAANPASGPLSDPLVKAYLLKNANNENIIGFETFTDICRLKIFPCSAEKTMKANPYFAFASSVKEITSCENSSPPTPPGFTPFAIGPTHTCFIQQPKGALFCWGDNREGQIGDGTVGGFRSTPRKVFDSGVTKVSASKHSTCAIKEEALYCWGSRSQLKSQGNPKKIFTKEVKDVRAISIGAENSSNCAHAVLVMDALFCISPDSIEPRKVLSSGVTLLGGNAFVHLTIANGDLYSIDGYGLEKVNANQNVPKVKYLLNNLETRLISGTGKPVCLISEEGALYCNALGDIANCKAGTYCKLIASGVTDVSETGFGGQPWSAFCAIMSGDLYCGSFFSSTPSQVYLANQLYLNDLKTRCDNPNPTLLSDKKKYFSTCSTFGQGVTSVKASFPNERCFLQSGKLRCSGWKFRQEEDSSITNITYYDGSLRKGILDFENLGDTILFSAGVSTFESGFFRTCALVNGEPYCWGSNAYGELGIGKGGVTAPKTILPNGVKSIFTNRTTDFPAEHAIPYTTSGFTAACAIMQSGELRCWGNSQYLGKLRTGDILDPYPSAENSLVKFYQKPEQFFFQSGVSEVILGRGTNFAIFNNEVYGWGSNEKSEIYSSPSVNGTNYPLPHKTEYQFPISHYKNLVSPQIINNDYMIYKGSLINMRAGNEIIRGPIIQYVFGSAAGSISNHCLIKLGGLYCFGANESGQIGDGTTAQRDISNPYPVFSSGVQSVEVSPSGQTTCAVVNDALFCWGNNYEGQVGNGTTNNQYTPYKVIEKNVKQVSMGVSFTCAVLNTGELKCWGNNSASQTGDGTAVYLNPQKVLLPKE